MEGTLICFECFCRNSDYVPLAGDTLHIPKEIFHQFRNLQEDLDKRFLLVLDVHEKIVLFLAFLGDAILKEIRYNILTSEKLKCVDTMEFA